jgi:AraC-like DNA-binding protein
MMLQELMISDYEKQQLLQVRSLLEQELTKHYSLYELARKAGLNRFKLTYGFRLLYGNSIYRYLKEKRMARAIELLYFEEMAVKEVSYACGFTNPHNFSTAFRQFYGCTPLEFRRKIRIAS